MKIILQLLAAIMFLAALICLGAGLVLGELPFAIGGLISGLVFAMILYALSEITDRLDILQENQRRLIKAFNARDPALPVQKQQRGMRDEFPGM